METYICARCGEVRDSDETAVHDEEQDIVVCVDCLEPDELVKLAEALDDVECIAKGLWTTDELASGIPPLEVKRDALERRLAADPDSHSWARPILDRVNLQISGAESADPRGA